MTTGKLYKHSKCIDVAFCPERIEELGGGFVCTGYWWRVGNNTTPKLLELDTIAIGNMDIDQWELYEE
jgi:hypothetical protein